MKSASRLPQLVLICALLVVQMPMHTVLHAQGSTDGHSIFLPWVGRPHDLRIVSQAIKVWGKFSEHAYVGGGVVNQAMSPLFDVTIQVDLLDSGGQLVKTEVVSTTLRRIDPGQVVGFHTSEFNFFGPVRRTAATIRSYALTNPARLVAVRTVHEAMECEYGYPYSPSCVITGTVRNDYNTPVRNVRVYPAADFSYVHGDIAVIEPGTTASYYIQFVPTLVTVAGVSDARAEGILDP